MRLREQRCAALRIQLPDLSPYESPIPIPVDRTGSKRTSSPLAPFLAFSTDFAIIAWHESNILSGRLPHAFMKGITNLFGPVNVLYQVDFNVYPGEVHILAGENGAGKGTHMMILAGAFGEYPSITVVDNFFLCQPVTW
jgi:ABC-type multidrug transport system fused ATPase/permease subunit